MNNFYKIIKSIHVISKLPIHVFDKKFLLKNLYVSNQVYILPYDFKKHLTQHNSKKSPYLFSGIFDEVFLQFCFKDIILILGPFITNHLDENNILKKIRTITRDENYENHLSRYLHHLPVFPLGDIRDILILLNFIFNGDDECPYSKELHQQVSLNETKIKNNTINNYTNRIFNAENYLYYYEAQLLDLVRKGDLKSLKENLAKTSNSIIPNVSGDFIRTEKNYTIIILEKLSSQSIQLGHDITNIYRLRDFYIKQLENITELMDVLYVRDTAIIHFTKIMHDFLSGSCSSFVKSVIQFIGLNLYSSIKISDIANKFFVSESTLRSKFKKETGLSVIEYINKRKINEAKLLLRSGLSPLEVSGTLDYYDYSHFYKTFKKFTGISPKDYQFSTNLLDKEKII